MPRPPKSVRIPSYARTALDDVVQRTQRPISLLIQDSIADLSRAYLNDPCVIARYVTPAAQHDSGPMFRVSIVYTAASEQILHALSQDSGIAVGAVSRAAWLRWLEVRGVEALIRTYGAVRPPLAGEGMSA